MKTLRTLYLKTRLINLNSVLPSVMTEMTQQPIAGYNKMDNLNNTLEFYTAKLLIYQTKDSSNGILNFESQVKKNLIDPDLFNETEKLEYNRSLLTLKDFNDLDIFMNFLLNLNKNVTNLYLKLSIDIANSNIFSYNDDTKEEFINILKETSDMYKVAIDMCENYPEWKDKINEDIGNKWSLIYSLHKQNNDIEVLFDEKSFDRYYFFK